MNLIIFLIFASVICYILRDFIKYFLIRFLGIDEYRDKFDFLNSEYGYVKTMHEKINSINRKVIDSSDINAVIIDNISGRVCVHAKFVRALLDIAKENGYDISDDGEILPKIEEIKF